MNTSLSELTRPKANILPARFQASLVSERFTRGFVNEEELRHLSRQPRRENFILYAVKKKKFPVEVLAGVRALCQG